MISDNKKLALKLVRQSVGTAKKIEVMIEEDAYCPEIIQQMDSIIGTLESAKTKLLLGHLHGCLECQLKENKEKAIEELIKIFKLS